jgi:ribonucleoside-diphosphate reductase subunit M2
MKIRVLSKRGCTGCVEARDLLRARGVEYTVEEPDRDQLLALTGRTTFPQIFMGAQLLDEGSLEYVLDDPVTRPNPNRFTVFPLRFPELWSLYKKAQMSTWTAEEVDLSRDLDDWGKMTDTERHFIKMVLAFFAASDGIVFENISLNFGTEVQIAEARSFYAFQQHNEMVHGETYSLLIEKYIRDPFEKDTVFRAIETMPCISKKSHWALKWFSKDRPFGERLFAFACIEGIFFSGAFCAIFWLKKRGLLPGLSFSNELISRDEGLHLEFAVALLQMIRLRPTSERVHEIVTEAVELEKEFILEALPCKLIGMDASKMSQYIEYVADRLLKQSGLAAPIWGSTCPFDFMENLSLEGKTNFFEKRVGDYSKFDSGADIAFDDEF